MNKDEVMEEDRCSKATPDDICDGALKHYNEMSTREHSWMSTIPHAIEVYRKFLKKELIDEERLIQLNKRLNKQCSDKDEIKSIIIANSVKKYIVGKKTIIMELNDTKVDELAGTLVGSVPKKENLDKIAKLENEIEVLKARLTAFQTIV